MSLGTGSIDNTLSIPRSPPNRSIIPDSHRICCRRYPTKGYESRLPQETPCCNGCRNNHLPFLSVDSCLCLSEGMHTSIQDTNCRGIYRGEAGGPGSKVHLVNKLRYIFPVQWSRVFRTLKFNASFPISNITFNSKIVIPTGVCPCRNQTKA